MLNIILHSNLFNFAVFLVIIILIAKKFDVAALIEKMRDDVIKKIDESDRAKSNAISELENTKLVVSKTESEIKEIENNAQKTSEIMKADIMEDVNKKVNAIVQNSENIIKNEEKNITSLLVSKLGQKSVELAKNYVIEELNANPNLHVKFIDAGIEELERAVL